MPSKSSTLTDRRENEAARYAVVPVSMLRLVGGEAAGGSEDFVVRAQLGKYQLVAEIARGGMGIVYLAVAQGPARFSKLLVVKELKPELVEDETFLEMFLEEARLAARLSHPNIVQTYEVGEENKRHYIVMDYLDGMTLARVLRRKPALFTQNMHLRVICEILAGLHYAHTLTDFDGTDLGIVHRDVTPQNVFITFDGTAKVVDFGIAKALDSGIETRTGILKGKPAYMAPEQIGGDVDRRADVFSAGVMIWEAIAGQRMWAKKGDVEVLTSMLKGEVPSLREHVPGVPDELARIVERALAKDREDRHESAAALQHELEAYLSTDPTATMREVGRVVGDLFSEERTTTRATIDAHLARLRTDGPPASEKLPSLPPPAETIRSSSTEPAFWDRSPPSGVASVGTPAGASISTSQNGAPLPPPEPKRSSHLKAWIIGGVAVLLTGAGFALGLGARDNDGASSGAKLAEMVATTSTGGPVTSASAQAVAGTATGALPVSEPPTKAITESAPSASSSATTAPHERPKVAAVPVTPPPRQTWTPPRSAAPSRPAPTAAATPAGTPETRSPEPSDDSKSKTGYLTIDTYPWTRVSTGGRVLGDTPLVHVPLSTGTHTLVLENPTEKVKQTTVVTIKPGETLSRRLAF